MKNKHLSSRNTRTNLERRNLASDSEASLCLFPSEKGWHLIHYILNLLLSCLILLYVGYLSSQLLCSFFIFLSGLCCCTSFHSKLTCVAGVHSVLLMDTVFLASGCLTRHAYNILSRASVNIAVCFLGHEHQSLSRSPERGCLSQLSRQSCHCAPSRLARQTSAALRRLQYWLQYWLLLESFSFHPGAFIVVLICTWLLTSKVEHSAPWWHRTGT